MKNNKEELGKKMLNRLLLNSLFSNFISGFQFVVILNYFSTKTSMAEAIKFSALALLLNRIGRLLAVSGSLVNSLSLKKNDHLVFSIFLLLSFIFQMLPNDLNIFISAFFLGIGMSGTTIAQRWRITDVAVPNTNLNYSINSIVGWGLGIILPSILIFLNLMFVGMLFQASTLAVIVIVSILIKNQEPETASLKTSSKENFTPIQFDMRSDQIKYFYVFFSAFIVACSASIFNGMLINLLKVEHHLNDLQVSLSFLMNLLGAIVLLFFPKILMKKNSSIWLSVSNLGFLLLTLSLFINFNVYTVFLILFFIGFVNTISSTFQLDIISTINPFVMSLRRIHVFAELFAIFGGALIYMLSRFEIDTKVQIAVLFTLAAIGLFVNIIRELKINPTIYKLRLVCGHDLDFLVSLYSECEDPTIGQNKFPEHRKKHFSHTGNISIPLNPPLDGFTELVYYIIEDTEGNPIGCVTNLRNEEGHEDLGMLLKAQARSQGLVSKVLLLSVAIRKQLANKITGLISETNIACIRASVKAGAKILDKSEYLNFPTKFLNVEFYKRGQL